MSSYGNRNSLIEPQGAQLSWGWSGVAGDDDVFPKGTVSKAVPSSSRVPTDSTPTYTTPRPSANGTKRTLGGSMDLKNLAKKQKTHDTGTSSRPARNLDANPTGLGRGPSVRPSTARPTNMPFSVDDSSSENEETNAPAPARPRFKVPSPFEPPAPTTLLPKELSKAEQQAMSKKLREEAWARRGASVVPSSSKTVLAGSEPIRNLPVTSGFKQPAAKHLRGENERTRRLETGRKLREETNKMRLKQRASSNLPVSSTRSCISPPPVRRAFGSPFRPSTRESQSHSKELQAAKRSKPSIINLDTDDEEEEVDLMTTIKKSTGHKTHSKKIAPAELSSSEKSAGATTMASTNPTNLNVSPSSPYGTAGARKQTFDAIPRPIDATGPHDGPIPAFPSSDRVPSVDSKPNLSAHCDYLPDDHAAPPKARTRDAKDINKAEIGGAETEHAKQHRLRMERDAADQKLQLELEQKQQAAKQMAEAARKTAEENRAKEEDQAHREQERKEEQQRLERAKSQEQRRLREEADRQQALKSRQEEAVARKAQESLQEAFKQQEAVRKERQAASLAEAAKKKADQEARAEEALILEARETLRKKEERIRKQQERNAILRKDDHSSDDELTVGEPPPVPAVLRPKSLAVAARDIEQQRGEDTKLDMSEHPGPMSLNSLAGARAVAEATRSNTETAKPVKGSKSRPLGQILPEDAAILHWRGMGDSWSTVITKYEDMTKKRRAEDTLKRRYHQVRKAFNAAQIGPALIQQLMNDEANARQQVNEKIHGEWPIPMRSSAANAASLQLSKLCNSETNGINGSSHRDSPSNRQHKGHSDGEARDTSKPQKLAANLQGGHTILPSDAKLFCWRWQEAREWAEISRLYERYTGRQSSHAALKRRYREVKEILDNAGIEIDLIDSLAENDEEAKGDIKRLIEQYRNELASRTEPGNDGRQDSPVQSHEISPQTSFTASKSSNTLSASPTPRPTTGGKQLTADNLWNLMEHQAAVWQQLDEEAYQPSQVDSDDPEDYNYHVYRVARRESTRQEQDEGVDIDTKPWTYSVEEYEDLDEANAAAYHESILTLPGHTDFHKGTFAQKSDFDVRGCRYIQIDNDAVGTLMIAVDRCTRTYRERILPKTKEHWKPSFYYVVHSRTENSKDMVEIVTEEVDEVLGETIKVLSRYIPVSAKPVPGTGTYTLEEANRRAAAEFARLTASSSGNLSRDDAIRERRIEGLLKDFEEYGEGAEAVFEVGEMGKGGVKVWVEKVGVSGARN